MTTLRASAVNARRPRGARSKRMGRAKSIDGAEHSVTIEGVMAGLLIVDHDGVHIRVRVAP